MATVSSNINGQYGAINKPNLTSQPDGIYAHPKKAIKRLFAQVLEHALTTTMDKLDDAVQASIDDAFKAPAQQAAGTTNTGDTTDTGESETADTSDGDDAAIADTGDTDAASEATAKAKSQTLQKTASQLVSELFFAPLMAQMREFPFGKQFSSGGRGEEVFGQQLDQRIADSVAASDKGGLTGSIVKRLDERVQRGQS